MSDIYCYAYVEDRPSKAVLKRLVDERNSRCAHSVRFREGFPHITNGYGAIKKMAPKFLNMSDMGLYTIAMTDLDQWDCPSEMIQSWFSLPSNQVDLPREVVFRIAVREIESWIIADRNAFANFLEIPAINFTHTPDLLSDPKSHLLSIIRSKGEKAWHREMLAGKISRIGPRYNDRICQFVENKWSPVRASENSPSLRRARVALMRL